MCRFIKNKLKAFTTSEVGVYHPCNGVSSQKSSAGSSGSSRTLEQKRRGPFCRQELPVRAGGPVAGGVGAAVDVAVGLQAVLGRSHHVGRFHRGPGSERRDGDMNTRTF